jgi:hypothetical protein
MYKIIGADGRDYGPVSAAELREWISEGRANARTQVQVEGSSEWRTLGALPEFAADLGAVALRARPAMPLVVIGNSASAATNSMAVAGFIFALLGSPGMCCCYCCCLTLPCSFLGLIFSCVGLSQINQNPAQGGRGLAIAGIVLSILGLVLFVGWMIFGAANAAVNPSAFRQ